MTDCEITEEEMMQRWYEGCEEYAHEYGVAVPRVLWEDETTRDTVLASARRLLARNFSLFVDAHPELGLKDWCLRDGGIMDYGKERLLRWYSIPKREAA